MFLSPKASTFCITINIVVFISLNALLCATVILDLAYREVSLASRTQFIVHRPDNKWPDQMSSPPINAS